jgi:hypothetical protein
MMHGNEWLQRVTKNQETGTVTNLSSGTEAGAQEGRGQGSRLRRLRLNLKRAARTRRVVVKAGEIAMDREF